GGDYEGDFSPDGARYVFERTWCGTGDDPAAGALAGLWIGDATGKARAVEVLPRGTVNPNESAPRWSPDGQWIVFGDDAQGLSITHPDGSGWRSIDLPDSSYAYSPDWSPDGRWIMFSLWLASEKRSELYVVRPDGSDLTRITTADGTEDG